MRSQEDLKLEARVKKFAETMRLELTQELALYQIYGDTPRDEWEMPVPKWVKKLPKGNLIKKKMK